MRLKPDFLLELLGNPSEFQMEGPPGIRCAEGQEGRFWSFLSLFPSFLFCGWQELPPLLPFSVL